MLDNSRTRLKRPKEAQSTLRYCWHKNLPLFAMLRSITVKIFVSSNVLKFALLIFTAHLVVSVGALLLILISSPSLPIISCPRFCVTMACWNMLPDWSNASIIRTFSHLVERRRWNCGLRQSGLVNYSGVKCLEYLDRLLRQLRSINCYGSLVKTLRKCVHITVLEPFIINNLCNYTLYLHH